MVNHKVYKEFKHEGYDCMIREITMVDVVNFDKHLDDVVKNKSWLCGYVKVPKWHRLSDYKNYDEANGLEVHGGVTFVGDFDEDFNLGSDFWIGFDCNHAFDKREVCDDKYVVNEIKNLVRQIKERITEKKGTK